MINTQTKVKGVTKVMTKAECIYLTRNDINDAFREKGYEVAIYSNKNIPYVFCCGDTAMKNKFDDNNVNLIDVVSEYIGKDVFFMLTCCKGDKWSPDHFIAFIR